MFPPRLVYHRPSQAPALPSTRPPERPGGGLPRYEAPSTGAAAAVGLSKSHNSTHGVSLCYEGASLFRLKYPAGEQPEREQKPREEIEEFSSKSRQRLRLFLAMMERACLPFMLTLTYPGEFSTDDRVWKADLKTWFARLKRSYPQVAAVWKLEFQKRGAPHFHLFLWGIEMDEMWSDRGKANPVNQMNAMSYGDFRRWAERAWFEVVGSGDERHLRAGCNLQRIQKPGRLMNYVAGYVSKEDQSLPGQKVGRYWGCHNRAVLPMKEAEETPMERDDYIAVRRMARRFTHANRMVAFHRARAAGRKMPKPRQRNNMSVAMICDADQWKRRIPAIIENRRWHLHQRVNPK